MHFFPALALLTLSTNAYAIIGGTEISDAGELAHSVTALQMVDTSSPDSASFYKGSAVVIGNNVLLTAGHNFFYLPEVRDSEAIFSTRPTWGARPKGELRIRVRKVALYPGFRQTPLGTENDLALVQLEQPVPSGYVPLKLDFSPLRADQMLVIAGYGRSIADGAAPVSDYRLRKVALPFARTTTQKLWLSNHNGSIAGGDSGGPALVREKGAYRVRGIAVHPRYDACVRSKSCEDQSAVDDLAYFRNWIEKTFRDFASE